MTEQILAYGGQNSYAQSEGAFTMSGSEPRESRPPRIESSERGQGHEASQQAERQRAPEASLFKPLNRPESERPSVPFSMAEPAITIINQIQNEKDVIASGDDLAKMRMLNEQFGNSDDARKLTEPEDVVVYAQEVLRNSRIEEPTAEELHYTKDSPHAEGQKAVLKRQIAQAQGRNMETGVEDEEILTREKVQKHLTVEDYKVGLAKEGGPGAMRGGAKTIDEEIEKLDPDTVVAEAQMYLREMKRALKRPSPATRFKDFQTIERNMTDAILEGKLDASDPGVEMVRDLLTERIDKYAGETSEDTPPAERLLETTTKVREILEDLINLDESTVEWENRKVELLDIVGKARTSVGHLTSINVDKLKKGDLIVPGEESVKVYRYIFEVNRAIEEYEKQVRGSKNNREKLERAFDGKDNLELFIKPFQNRSKNLLRQADQHFTKLYENLSIDQQAATVGDITERANYYINSILGGWRDLDTATREIIGMIKQEDDTFGIREWRATRYYQRMIDAIRVSQLTQRPADWADVPKNLSSLYSFVEDSGVGTEELGPFIQRANALIEGMPASTPEEREKRLELNRRLEAFKAWHAIIITAEEKDMNPEALSNVYSQYFDGKQERTFEDFVVRFSEDTRGRNFYYVQKDSEGKPISGTETKVNLFDIQHALYSDLLRDERVLANMIQEMTKLGGIEGGFSKPQIELMKRNVGYDGLTPEWQAKWDLEFNKLREYFVKKTQALIDINSVDKDKKTGKPGKWHGKHLTVDQVWARLGGVSGDGEIDEKEFIKATKGLIDDWRRKRTIQGAFGTVKEADVTDLAVLITEDLQDFGVKDETIKDIKKDLEGSSFLDVRREVMQAKLRHRLEANNLSVDRAFKGERVDLRDADFDELDEVGFFGSADYNAYNWAWVVQWGNYETIRIYSPDRKTKWDDDYVLVTVHNSSSMFNSRAIEHGWEFFHEGNESRGRPKENDINVIFKQKFPGKHHYILPQNTPMVRWAEYFMTPEQKKLVGERTIELVRRWDFDNVKYHDEYVGWMRSVAVMDMIENGQISMGQREFSDVVKDKELTKFLGIDLNTDRAKHLKMMAPDQFQDYLTNPTEAKLIRIMDRLKGFYSTRVARSFPGFTQFFRAHWEVASKYRQQLFDRANLNSAGGEQLIQDLIQEGDMERKQGEKEKRKLLGYSEIGGRIPFTNKEMKLPLGELFGTVPFRRVRQFAEQMRKIGWDLKSTVFLDMPFSAVWEAIKEFFKQLPRQTMPGGR